MFSNRRTSRGSRPALRAASSIAAFDGAMSSAGRYASEGSQPSALRPVSRSIRGL